MRYQWKDLFIFVTYFVFIPQLAFCIGKCGNERENTIEKSNINTHLHSISLKIFWNIDGYRHDENRSQKFANPATRRLRIDCSPVVIGITYSHIAFVRNNYDQENRGC